MSKQAMKNTGSNDVLTGKIKPLYFKYLTAAFGSALISSIYSVVDMAMVGQYQGPNGTAALAVVSPIWNIIYSLGLLMGIGGSVLFSTLRGESEQNRKKSNEYFTASLMGTAILAVITWIAIIFFDRELLTLFGAEETLLPLAQRYLFPVKFAVPSFLLTQLMAAFLRNDGNPGLATKAVLSGGIFNVFGDWFFVFALDMGVMGAGLATVMGSVFSLLIMLTHFFSKRNTLRLERPAKLVSMLKSISVTGFSTFFIDVAMGILTMLFNRQILRYSGTDALSVYGIIINISTFVQCCAYSIGQASQPIISTNFGAHQGKRIREILKYALGTAAVFGLIWTTLAEFAPNFFVRIFMTPTDSILKIAPAIIRSYGISFLLLPLNIFSTYYFQALMKPSVSFIVSVSRGAVISGILIYLLPIISGADSIWFAMPVTELTVAIYVAIMMTRYTKRLSVKK
jgi:putative MATE family efflux protein